MGKLMGVEQLFEGRPFDREVIILCVRWYLRFKLSLRDLVEMMAERGLSLAHTTIMRWVWRYAPEFEKRWKRFAQAVGRSWRVDETYVNSPEPESSAGDQNRHLIEMPLRGWMTSAAKLPGEQRPELQHPTPDHFVGDVQPALGEQILDVAEAEGEAKVQPYCMPDDVRRELVAGE